MTKVIAINRDGERQELVPNWFYGDAASIVLVCLRLRYPFAVIVEDKR